MRRFSLLAIFNTNSTAREAIERRWYRRLDRSGMQHKSRQNFYTETSAAPLWGERGNIVMREFRYCVPRRRYLYLPVEVLKIFYAEIESISAKKETVK